MAHSSDVGSPIGPEFRIGEWIVRANAARLENESSILHVRPMLIDLLVYLAEKANRLVSKEEIVDRVWKGRPVSDSALSRNIAELRRLLGDEAGKPRYIETVPKRGYRLIAAVTSAFEREQPYIAVLPFANLSCDREQDYFADGMTDALITELGRTHSLRVVSRQSILHLRNSEKTAAQIGLELGIDFLIEGAVMRSGNAVRITAQLIRIFPEAHLWADSYEGELSEVLALQEKVAVAVARAIEAELGSTVRVLKSRHRIVNPRSFLAYIKARRLLGSWTEDAISKAFHHLGEAIEADPGFSSAYQAMAMCWVVLGYWGYLPIRDAYPQAKEAALQALDLDPDSGDAHGALGAVQWLLDWDLEASASRFQRAVELSPSSETAHLFLALFLITVRNDVEGCLEHAGQALELDPLSLNTNFSVAWLLLFTGKYEHAIVRAETTLEMYPESVHPLYVMGWAYVGQSKFKQAVGAFERALAISRDPITLAYLGHAYGRAGQRDAARNILTELHATAGMRHVPPIDFAVLHAGLDDLDEAFVWLDRCVEEHDSRLYWLRNVPAFEPLRHDKRYAALLRLLQLR